MADPNLLYAYPSDEWSHLITPTVVSGAADPSFPVANLGDSNPANPFKATGTAITLQWDRGSDQPFGLHALGHTNIDGTATLKISDDPTFATGVTSYVFATMSKDQEGYFDAAWLDLVAQAAPNKRYVQLVITGNSQTIIIGELSFNSTTRQLAHHVNSGSDIGATRPRIPPVKTIAGVEMYPQSYGRRRSFDGTIVYTPDVATAIDSWQQATGGSDQPTLIVPKDTVNPGAWLVRWSTANNADFKFKNVETGVISILVGWLEVAKGRPWGST